MKARGEKKPNLKILPVVVVILLGFCFAQDIPTAGSKALNEQWHTHGLYNGRYWNIMSDQEKLSYLSGLMDGLSQASPPVIQQYSVGGHLDASEVRTAIDQFYTDPTNFSVTIMGALRIVVMKIHGLPQPQIDAEISALRRSAMQTPRK